MTIWISSRFQAGGLASLHRPSHAIGLLAPGDDFPTFDAIEGERHLTLEMDDIDEADDTVPHQTLPGEDDVAKILALGESWDRKAPLLVHCYAGVSRSTASAFMIACLKNPEADEMDIAAALRRASPTAKPNRRLIELADQLLIRRGRMVDAVETMGPHDWCDEALPFRIEFDIRARNRRKASMSDPLGLRVGLSAVIVALVDGEPHVLATRTKTEAARAGLPFGPFKPGEHRTFELGLRDWVSAQTGFELGYVEQLYTFGDLGRDLPEARLETPGSAERIISVGYLALTPEATRIGAFEAVWCDWYRFFPWEDHRGGVPDLLSRHLIPALNVWCGTADTREACDQRSTRVRLAFGQGDAEWMEERVLERYELLYEAGLVPEYHRDHGRSGSDTVSEAAGGSAMRSDHRRILATAIGRLRAKVKYRPVIFELMENGFTLSALQAAMEGLLGLSLHKQNFRRAVEKTGLVEGLGDFETATGGRPAERFRFRREVLSERVALGIQTSVRRGAG